MGKVVIVFDSGDYIRNKKDRLSKQIMEIVEKHYKEMFGNDYRSRKDFAEIRSSVFDGVNELYRDFCLLMASKEEDTVVIQHDKDRERISHTNKSQQEGI